MGYKRNMKNYTFIYMLLCSVLHCILENTDSKSVSVYKDYFTKNQNSIINIDGSHVTHWSGKISPSCDPSANTGVIHLSGLQQVSIIASSYEEHLNEMVMKEPNELNETKIGWVMPYYLTLAPPDMKFEQA